MALVQFGGGVTGMRGSIGGTVFSRNAGGNYARARTVPVNPNSPLQAEIRAALQTLVEYWQNSLTQAERDAWNLYAANINMQNRLGETIHISGYNHFIRSNTIRVKEQLGRRNAGPTVMTLPEADPVFEVVADYGAQELVITFDDTRDWCNENSAHMIVSMSQPCNSAVNFIGKPFRIVDTIDGSASSAVSSPATLATLPWVIAADQVVGLKARISRDDSRLSEFFRDPRVPCTP